MASNIGYIANSGSLLTLTLPSTSTVGDTIRVTGKGSGGWTIATVMLANVSNMVLLQLPQELVAHHHQ
jgi:hypothetical protein